MEAPKAIDEGAAGIIIHCFEAVGQVYTMAGVVKYNLIKGIKLSGSPDTGIGMKTE